MKTGKPAPRIVIRPNCNFTGRGALLLFLAMTFPVLVVAIAWALRGYWLILPFAGLELVVLGIALAITVHRGGYREVIRFGTRFVGVRRGYAGRQEHVEFPRPRTRAWIEPGPSPALPGRLFLGAGRLVLRAGCLPDGGRKAIVVPAFARTDPRPGTPEKTRSDCLMKRSKAHRGWLILAMAGAALVAAGPAAADWALDFPASATELGDKVRGLHHMALIVCVVMGVIVFGAIGYSLVKFRKSQGAQAAKFSHSTKAEIIWTVIPVLILVGLAIPTARVLIEMEDTQSADLRILVTGYQWKWRYEYLDHGIDFFSNIDEASKAAAILHSDRSVHETEHYLRNVDKRMVVPVNRKVKLQLTSNDVIHGWWVPELYVKRDAVPGTINETWFQDSGNRVFTAVSARNFAGADTDSCRSWWKPCRKKSLTHGWPRNPARINLKQS